MADDMPRPPLQLPLFTPECLEALTSFMGLEDTGYAEILKTLALKGTKACLMAIIIVAGREINPAALNEVEHIPADDIIYSTLIGCGILFIGQLFLRICNDNVPEEDDDQSILKKLFTALQAKNLPYRLAELYFALFTGYGIGRAVDFIQRGNELAMLGYPIPVFIIAYAPPAIFQKYYILTTKGFNPKAPIMMDADNLSCPNYTIVGLALFFNCYIAAGLTKIGAEILNAIFGNLYTDQDTRDQAALANGVASAALQLTFFLSLLIPMNFNRSIRYTFRTQANTLTFMSYAFIFGTGLNVCLSGAVGFLMFGKTSAYKDLTPANTILPQVSIAAGIGALLLIVKGARQLCTKEQPAECKPPQDSPRRDQNFKSLGGGDMEAPATQPDRRTCLIL